MREEIKKVEDIEKTGDIKKCENNGSEINENKKIMTIILQIYG